MIMIMRLTVSVHGSEQQQMFFPKLLHSAPVAPVQYHRLLVVVMIVIRTRMIMMLVNINLFEN